MKKQNLLLTLSILIALSFLLTLSSCKKDDEASPPTLTTNEITEITATGANAGGTITDNGGAAVIMRGVCWSTSPNPTIASDKTEDGPGAGVFSSIITGLEPDTKYYIRAYATNSAGTAYGNQLELTTLPGFEVPTLTTAVVIEIDRNTAVSGGNVVSDGGAEVTARGVVWSTATSPTIDDNRTEDGTGSGAFVSNVANLESNTTYYLRAYATNVAGTAYGNELSFTTLEDGIVFDIEGNVYQTVIIGNQEWMAENLRTKTLLNGDPLAGPFAGSDWVQQSTTDKRAVYTIFNYEHSSAAGLESPEEVVAAYGKMYNWFAVETGILCPVGWRVPDTADWNKMIDFILADDPNFNETNVGIAVKSCRQINSPLGGECATEIHPRWRENNEHFGMNAYGLSLAGVGYILSSSGNSSWLGARGYWWTASENPANPETAIFRRFNFDDSAVTKGSFNKGVGQPVRCMRDNPR